ncbi:MAG: hypothetical protein VX899_16545 [Myxococcota bacterium]|nr:hypothetical protein [Myxococcota bacterium]
MSLPGRWRTLSALAVVFTLLLHMRFLSMDTRLPADLGQYFVALPELYRALFDGAPLGPALSDTFTRPGGWWNLVLALWLGLTGKTSMAWQLLDLSALGVLLALSGSVGDKVGRGPGRLAFTLLVAGNPMVLFGARATWVHLHEAVLLMAMLHLWLDDLRLERPRSLWSLGLLGALAIGLRPSALPWLGTLGLGIAVGRDGQRPSIKRLALLAGIWLLACVQLAPYLQRYLEAKAAARDRYEARVPQLSHQAVTALGRMAFPLALGALGLSLPLGGPFAPRRVDGPRLVAYAWVLLPIGLTISSKAGLDNFFPLALGLGWMAADIAGRWRWTVPIWAAPYLLMSLPQLLPPMPKDGPVGQFLGRNGIPMDSGPNSLYRPYRAFSAQETLELIQASCPDPGQPCDLVVDQGLFSAFGESSGALPLFLATDQPLRLVELRSPELPPDLQPAALVHWRCGAEDPREQMWRQRWPHSLRALTEMGREHQLALAWKRELGDCELQWYTPQGLVMDPMLLPHPGPVEDRLKVAPGAGMQGVNQDGRPRPRPRVPGQQR